MVGAGAVAPFDRGLSGAGIKSSSINSGNAILYNEKQPDNSKFTPENNESGYWWRKKVLYP
jgi:hypothetical protein